MPSLAVRLPTQQGLLQAREQVRQLRVQCRDLTQDLETARRQAAVRSNRCPLGAQKTFAAWHPQLHNAGL
jgi:hypothetical protein